jgi:hypothetical protein
MLGALSAAAFFDICHQMVDAYLPCEELNTDALM